MPETDTHPFQGSLRKTDRASVHLHELTRLRDEFLENEEEAPPFRVVEGIERNLSRYVMRAGIDRVFPDWWSLIVGDFVQNLRAALDHFVCQLIYDAGGEPSRQNGFPIFPKRPSRGRAQDYWEAQVAGLDDDAVAFIEACQPYHHEEGPSNHLFFALRELSNDDKHRLVLPAVCAIATPDEGFEITVLESRDVGPISRGKLHSGYALKTGDLIVEAPVEITGSDPDVSATADFTLELGFGGNPIVPTTALWQMFKSVRATLHHAAHDLRGYSSPIVEAELAGMLAIDG
jgi:hypothetical protein